MKYAEKDLVRAKRDPEAFGIIIATSPGNGNAQVISGNHYQVYWSSGTDYQLDVDETWYTEEELTPATSNQ